MAKAISQSLTGQSVCITWASLTTRHAGNAWQQQAGYMDLSMSKGRDRSAWPGEGFVGAISVNGSRCKRLGRKQQMSVCGESMM
jgi:hypothetical protein